MDEKIYFNTKKEKSEKYFLEYHPPNPGWRFSTLSINYVSDVKKEQVVEDIVNQSRIWIERYPVSLMAGAFDRNGDLIDLSTIKPGCHLISILKGSASFESWETQGDDEFPNLPIDEQLKIFKGFGFRTQTEINKKLDVQVKSKKMFKSLILVWAVIIPLSIAILEFFSPEWITALALCYSFWKAYKQWRLMTGRDEKSVKDKFKEEEGRTIMHHHYHCELNPKGFLRLKVENLKASLSQDVQKKYSEIE